MFGPGKYLQDNSGGFSGETHSLGEYQIYGYLKECNKILDNFI